MLEKLADLGLVFLCYRFLSLPEQLLVRTLSKSLATEARRQLLVSLCGCLDLSRQSPWKRSTPREVIEFLGIWAENRFDALRDASIQASLQTILCDAGLGWRDGPVLEAAMHAMQLVSLARMSRNAIRRLDFKISYSALCYLLQPKDAASPAEASAEDHERHPPPAISDLLISFPCLERLSLQVPTNARQIAYRAAAPSGYSGGVLAYQLARAPTDLPVGRLALQHLRALHLSCCSIPCSLWMPSTAATAAHTDAHSSGDPLLVVDLRACPALEYAHLAWPQLQTNLGQVAGILRSIDPSEFASQGLAAFVARHTSADDEGDGGTAAALGISLGGKSAPGGFARGIKKICDVLENKCLLWLCLPNGCNSVEVSGVGLRGIRWMDALGSREFEPINAQLQLLDKQASDGLVDHGTAGPHHVPQVLRLGNYEDTLESGEVDATAGLACSGSQAHDPDMAGIAPNHMKPKDIAQCLGYRGCFGRSGIAIVHPPSSMRALVLDVQQSIDADTLAAISKHCRYLYKVSAVVQPPHRVHLAAERLLGAASDLVHLITAYKNEEARRVRMHAGIEVHASEDSARTMCSGHDHSHARQRQRVKDTRLFDVAPAPAADSGLGGAGAAAVGLATDQPVEALEDLRADMDRLLVEAGGIIDRHGGTITSSHDRSAVAAADGFACIDSGSLEQLTLRCADPNGANAAAVRADQAVEELVFLRDQLRAMDESGRSIAANIGTSSGAAATAASVHGAVGSGELAAHAAGKSKPSREPESMHAFAERCLESSRHKLSQEGPMERRLVIGVRAPALRSLKAHGALDCRLALVQACPVLGSMELTGTGNGAVLGTQRLHWSSSRSVGDVGRKEVFDTEQARDRVLSLISCGQVRSQTQLERSLGMASLGSRRKSDGTEQTDGQVGADPVSGAGASAAPACERHAACHGVEPSSQHALLLDLQLSYLPLPPGGLLAAIRASEGSLQSLYLAMCAGIHADELMHVLQQSAKLGALVVKDGVHDSPPATSWSSPEGDTVNDACLDAIVDEGCPLRTLRLSHYHAVTAEGLQRLLDARGGKVDSLGVSDCARLEGLFYLVSLCLGPDSRFEYTLLMHTRFKIYATQ